MRYSSGLEKRSHTEIVRDVLDCLARNPGIRITRLMYACDLSWVALKEVLDMLEAKGHMHVLKEDVYQGQRERRELSIRAVGFDLLSKLNEVMGYLEPVGQFLEERQPQNRESEWVR